MEFDHCSPASALSQVDVVGAVRRGQESWNLFWDRELCRWNRKDVYRNLTNASYAAEKRVVIVMFCEDRCEDARSAG